MDQDFGSQVVDQLMKSDESGVGHVLAETPAERRGMSQQDVELASASLRLETDAKPEPEPSKTHLCLGVLVRATVVANGPAEPRDTNAGCVAHAAIGVVCAKRADRRHLASQRRPRRFGGA